MSETTKPTDKTEMPPAAKIIITGEIKEGDPVAVPITHAAPNAAPATPAPAPAKPAATPAPAPAKPATPAPKASGWTFFHK
jgi:hypothetical protein